MCVCVCVCVCVCKLFYIVVQYMIQRYLSNKTLTFNLISNQVLFPFSSNALNHPTAD